KAKLLEPRAGQEISIASMGWYPGTKGKVEGDVVYLKAESTKDLEKYKGKLKNAVVLLSPPRPVPKIEQIIGKADATKGGGGAGGGGRPRGAFGKRGGADFMAFRKALTTFLVKEGAAAIFQDSSKPFGLLVTTGNWGGGFGGGGEGGDRPSATN